MIDDADMPTLSTILGVGVSIVVATNFAAGSDELRLFFLPPVQVFLASFLGCWWCGGGVIYISIYIFSLPLLAFSLAPFLHTTRVCFALSFKLFGAHGALDARPKAYLESLFVGSESGSKSGRS